jgi:14-3-3 protein epsilon
MLEIMKKIVNLGDELSVEDRNLLSVAYKNSISGRRSAWRGLESLEKKAESKGQTQQLAYIREYKVKIRAELINICNDLIQLLDNTLIPKSQSAEAKVFYHKMKGDYFRYTSEVYNKTDAEYTKVGDSALASYNEATTVS